MEYCHDCDLMVDLDYNQEHFDEDGKCIIQNTQNKQRWDKKK